MTELGPAHSNVPSEPAASPAAPSLIDSVADWLMVQALEETANEAVFEGCCEQILAAGLPLFRAHIAFRTLHPLFNGRGFTWTRGKPLDVQSYPHVEGPQPERWLKSTHFHMITRNIPVMRRRLVGPEAMLDFPILDELHALGVTDYLAFTVRFSHQGDDGVVASWATDRPSGFSDADIAALMRVQRRLAVVCKMRTRSEVARNVMTTYLGADAGLRVLDGQIRRGDGEAIDAAIWYCDLRGSTRMAEIMPATDYIELLNAFFDATAGAVLAAGGEILGFIGDAVLAMFPVKTEHDGRAECCRRAIAASDEARRRIDALNAAREADGLPRLAFGLGLHLGEVRFGNIGVPERLSFSVIGPVVNEVARLEALTKTLGRPVLASAAFAEAVAPGWEPLGSHTVDGVAKPLEVFAPGTRPAAG
jgi:adenylate cyclase